VAVKTDFSFHGHDAAHDIVAETEHINTLLPPGSIKTIVYVGCCCGYEAGQLSEVYPDAEVYAIEAVEETFDRYLRSVRSCCAGRVKTTCRTISHTNGRTALHMAEMNTQHSVLNPLDWEVVETRYVPCETLQRYCAGADIHPDMLVLDVEGTPGRVLVGAGPDILSTIKVVIAETEPAGADVFEMGDSDEWVARLLHIYGLERVLCSVPSPPVRQLNSVWVRKP
jgi:FkbM family methyltransferase